MLVHGFQLFTVTKYVLFLSYKMDRVPFDKILDCMLN